MKRFLLFVLIIPLVLAACSPAAPAPADAVTDQKPPAAVVSNNAEATPQPPAGTSAAAVALTMEFEDAASVRSQLAYGTLLLEETPHAITSDQARALLPLWQAMSALTGNTASVPEELDAVQNQIFAGMQPEQLQAIADLQITNTRIAEFYAEKGIVLPTLEAGVTRDPGAMRNLPEAAREATRAARQASGLTGGGQGMGQLTKTLLFDEVIKLLEATAAQ